MQRDAEIIDFMEYLRHKNEDKYLENEIKDIISKLTDSIKKHNEIPDLINDNL